ncbi:MAG: hypothetical protein AAGI17_01585 [Planctomycetota bacterium]
MRLVVRALELLVATVLAFAAWYLAFVLLTFLLGDRGIVALAALVAVAVAWPWLFRRYRRWRLDRWVHSREQEAELVRKGVCGRCGYGITGLPADRFGRVTCPECTAKWRSPDRRD